MAQNFREPIVVNEEDLANGYYNHLPKVTMEEMQKVLGWLDSQNIPDESGFWTAKGTDPVKNEEKYLPTEIQWTKDGEEDLFLDAALVYNFPHVARVELLKYFGMAGADVLVMYDKPRESVQFVKASPVGDYWPEQGFYAYRSASGDNFPFGAKYTDSYGRVYVKERRQVAFWSFAVWILQRPQPTISF